jgi:hypothetical protein
MKWQERLAILGTIIVLGFLCMGALGAGPEPAIRMDSTPRPVRKCWEVDLQVDVMKSAYRDNWSPHINGVICEKP